MAATKPIAAPRPTPGVRRGATHSGVTHVRAYQSSHYTIVGNHLAQHRALSLTAIGLAVHILSLPQGAPVDIRSLADRFPEGRDRIAFGLRELETHGYLERVRERADGGRFVTRTYAHNAPALTRSRAEAPGIRDEPVVSVAPVTRAVPVAPAVPLAVAEVAGAEGADVPVPEEPPPVPLEACEQEPFSSEHRDKASALLAGLRRTDYRFTLSRKDVERLTPAVVAWFDNGASRAAVIHAMTADVPVPLKSPAGFLAHRLREGLPPPLPPLSPFTAPGEDTAPAPVATTPELWGERWKDCEGDCTRVLPTAGPERVCRDCRARRAATAPMPALVPAPAV
ncbi:helix-turn-helix domain-containing protein [Streptomyces sp. ID05-39B]|uniref:helix-turn-helix domain-containing protein n=1 Tax=Streptomyces sp. ID05-39B TaxID=3028664 RepID=UPI0029BABFCC|nr:helix-turn-helix domain-containing protein [Streptomyces sp. ID05-39B]MDX3530655.1 helix-turn-helix domain-containing protein [Streptomyces sp. ID05-39B]